MAKTDNPSSTPDYHYLDRLNGQQRDAVEYLGGPELVIAGAGSGKTRVLTYKIVHLLNSGFLPSQILALTFTNKAAREMKDRVAALTGAATAARIRMGTFHSVFLRILRGYAGVLGFNSNFSIYDAADSKNLVKMIIRDLDLSDKTYKPATIAAIISNAKNAMMTPDEYERNYGADDRRAKRPATTQIFRKYVERCRVANVMDFDDIIFFMNMLLRDHPQIREELSQRFRYVLVDEYQDTNFAQHLAVKQLVAPKNMLCVVGDDAQSIYSFRGANIANIISLEKEYPGLRTFKLEQNYRSTQNIVNAAGSLIEKNTRQMPKHVFSENSEGAPVEIIQTYSDLEEAALVSAHIQNSKLTWHDSYEDYAILYRTNAQSRVLEEALRKRSIAYRIYGGTAFYQRKEVKDAVAYFRTIVNPDDDEAIRRIINYPPRGIGDTTMKKVIASASEHTVSLWNVISDPQAYSLQINSGTLRKLKQFADMISLFIDDNRQSDAYELAQLVFNRTGILAMLATENTPESISRQENLRELLAGTKEFVDSRRESGDDDLSMRAFLSEVMLATDQDEKDTDPDDKVTLMTAHAAKGLEFKHVYIVGVEEELFPSAMAMDSLAQVEEERRLLYVAITRAMETCTLSYASSRFRNGQVSLTSPSRFINDIDRRFVSRGSTDKADIDDLKSFSRPSENYRQHAVRTSTSPAHSSPDLSKLRRASVAKKTSDAPMHTIDELKIGMTIEHQKLGVGKIIAFGQVSGSDSITVDFGLMGEKKLMLLFAKFDIRD